MAFIARGAYGLAYGQRQHRRKGGRGFSGMKTVRSMSSRILVAPGCMLGWRVRAEIQRKGLKEDLGSKDLLGGRMGWRSWCI